VLTLPRRRDDEPPARFNQKAKEAATYVKNADAVSGDLAQEILRTARGRSRQL
jgi:hypothetical protein